MRTNIEIDDALMDEALTLSQLKTKKEVVDQALRQFINRLRRLRILELQGKVEWRGDLTEMRGH